MGDNFSNLYLFISSLVHIFLEGSLFFFCGWNFRCFWRGPKKNLGMGQIYFFLAIKFFFGEAWLTLATLGYSLPFLATLGYSWLIFATFGYFRLLLTTLDYFWLLCATLDYFLQLLDTFDFFWICSTNFCSLGLIWANLRYFRLVTFG